MIKVSFNSFETCKPFQGQFLLALIVHTIMAPHKTCPQAAQIHVSGSFENWRYTVALMVTVDRHCLSFLFEQPFGYLVRGEQTNQITNVTKALCVYSDRTRTFQTMSCLRPMKNMHPVNQKLDTCYLLLNYHYIQIMVRRVESRIQIPIVSNN